MATRSIAFSLWAAGILICSFLYPSLSSTSTRLEDVALQWNGAALQGLRDAKMAAPMAARALAIVHTCMYDAWTAYDEKAVGTQLRGALRRPVNERIEANKNRAISYAAYRALEDVLPLDTELVYKPLMQRLGYDPEDNSTDIEMPTGIGNVTCAAVLEFRHHDKSNQLGDLAEGPYSDWSGYAPLNTPTTLPIRVVLTDPDHWQPLIYDDAAGNLVLQKFAAVQWCFVTPFALAKGEELRADLNLPPAKLGSPEYLEQAEELLTLSANLTDKQKMISEYWSDGPYSEQPPGHWMRFAQFISARDHHSLDDDVKMFFALSNAMLDASVRSRHVSPLRRHPLRACRRDWP
jgi:hypothetical protein